MLAAFSMVTAAAQLQFSADEHAVNFNGID
jgi:hypothetical protein